MHLIVDTELISIITGILAGTSPHLETKPVIPKDTKDYTVSYHYDTIVFIILLKHRDTWLTIYGIDNQFYIAKSHFSPELFSGTVIRGYLVKDRIILTDCIWYCGKDVQKEGIRVRLSYLNKIYSGFKRNAAIDPYVITINDFVEHIHHESFFSTQTTEAAGWLFQHPTKDAFIVPYYDIPNRADRMDKQHLPIVHPAHLAAAVYADFLVLPTETVDLYHLHIDNKFYDSAIIPDLETSSKMRGYALPAVMTCRYNSDPAFSGWTPIYVSPRKETSTYAFIKGLSLNPS
jgi:hypothetical protein